VRRATVHENAIAKLTVDMCLSHKISESIEIYDRPVSRSHDLLPLVHDLSSSHAAEIDNRTFHVAIAGMASSTQHTFRQRKTLDTHLPVRLVGMRDTRAPVLMGDDRSGPKVSRCKKRGRQSACATVVFHALVARTRNQPVTLRRSGDLVDGALLPNFLASP
jgi:hypothetical protein